jgi:hypothetical protein
MDDARLAEALERIETRMDELERRLSALEAGEREQGRPDICSCSDDLIGCLDDCVDDVEELRKRARDVRTAERGP